MKRESRNLPTKITNLKNDTPIRKKIKRVGQVKAQVDKSMTRNGQRINNANGKSILSSKLRKLNAKPKN